MGLQNAAQSFQRLLQDVIGDMDQAFGYLDDILLFSETEQEHLTLVDDLFKRLEAAGLTINLKKCVFGQDTIEYLGYTVNKDGIAPIARKITAIENFPEPSKQKDLLAFLGALNYYRASLPSLDPEESSGTVKPSSSRLPAEVLDPLYKLATCQLTKQKGCGFIDVWNSSELVRN